MERGFATRECTLGGSEILELRGAPPPSGKLVAGCKPALHIGLATVPQLGDGLRDMTTEEIQQHVDEKVRANFDGYRVESLEMMTSEEGDGRFFGKVFATVYLGLPPAPELYLAIGETEKKVQIVKFGRSECIHPKQDDLDFLLRKELGIGSEV